MNRNSPFEEILDKWAKRELPYEAIQTFAEDHGIMNHQDEATLHELVIKGIQTENLNNRIANFHEGFVKDKQRAKAKKNPVSISGKVIFLRIAASVILLVSLFIFKDTFFVTTDSLASGMFTEYYLVNERSENLTQKENLVTLFSEKSYEELITAYEAIKKPEVRENFLAGYSYYILKNYDKSIPVFKTILLQNKKQTIPFYNDEAEYYLGLSLLQSGNYKAAYQQLKEIYENQNHTYHPKIKKTDLFRLRIKAIF